MRVRRPPTLCLEVRASNPTIRYRRDVEFTALNFVQWDFFFLFASVIGLYALHRLSLVREEGHVKEGVVLDALFQIARRGMRNLSTVAGLRAATEYNLEGLRNGERTESDAAAKKHDTELID